MTPKLGLVYCVACDSSTTYINPDGAPYWRIHDGQRMCMSCYQKYVSSPVYNPETHRKFVPRQLVFKDKRIHAPYNPRKGICQQCGAKIGIDCKQTHIHHKEYHDEDPLKATMELCASCHAYETWKTRGRKNVK